MRLNQYIARCGKASRRTAEAMILDGRVQVEGEIRVDLGCQVTTDSQVKLDGRLLKVPTESTVLMLNKPRGILTTTADPGGRSTVMDFVDLSAHVSPIGRLDKESSGLLLLTDDGQLAHLLMSPSSHLPKEYLVQTREELSDEGLDRFRRGMKLDGRRTREASIERVGRSENRPRYRIVLNEGRNRQIRRMMAMLGVKVVRLSRRRYGGIDIGNLEPGEWRILGKGEIDKLRSQCQAKEESETQGAARKPTKSKPSRARAYKPRTAGAPSARSNTDRKSKYTIERPERKRGRQSR
jgi:23S rRNA pseudouridine2605 synthase